MDNKSQKIKNCLNYKCKAIKDMNPRKNYYNNADENLLNAKALKTLLPILIKRKESTKGGRLKR